MMLADEFDIVAQELVDEVVVQKSRCSESVENTPEVVGGIFVGDVWCPFVFGNNKTEATSEGSQPSCVEPKDKEEDSFVVTKPLTVDGHRVVEAAHSDTYARKVLDECKAKFGTPKPTEANHKAVWKFAVQIMQKHGLRPTHIARTVPYVAALVFEPSMEERAAGIVKGAWRELVADRYEQHLTRLGRWGSKLQRAFL